MVESLKDYVTKALINTIDHLGSVAFKVNSLVDQKFGEVSALELHFCCLQQVLKTNTSFLPSLIELDRNGYKLFQTMN